MGSRRSDHSRAGSADPGRRRGGLARAVRGPGVALAMLGALAGAAPAMAARPDATTVPLVQGGPHVLVHYAPVGDPVLGVPDATAIAVRDEAEQAWKVIFGPGGWGWPTLPDNTPVGDDRIDIYVVKLPAILNGLTTTEPPAPSAPVAPAYILLDKDTGTGLRTVGHELMHVGQGAVARGVEDWIDEGTADWGGRLIASTPTDRFYDPATPLDCFNADPAVGCARGYRTQPYFKNIAARFGVPVIRAIYTGWPAFSAAGPRPGLHAIDAVLAGAGSSLSTTFAEFATAFAARGPMPTVRYATAGSGVLTRTTVSVDHLAARYLTYTAVGVAAGCRPATLHLSVAVPPGQPAPPRFWLPATGQVIALQGAGTATADIAWSTCNAAGTLVLPNATWTSDGQSFTVNGSVEAAPLPQAPPAVSPAPAPAPRPRFKKPQLQIVRVSRRPTSRGVVTLTLACRTALPGGCGGSATLRATFHGRRAVLTTRRWTAPTSAAVTVRLQLGRRARRIARSVRRLALQVVANDAGPLAAAAARRLSGLRR